MRRNIYDSTGKEVTPSDAANGDLTESLRKEPQQYFCHSCGKDCTRVRYHNAKAPPSNIPGKQAVAGKLDLCPSCYMEARFPANTSSGDYAKLETERYTSIADRDAPWTDAELLLLLEGLELYDENWDSVATHVGSRTREECVLKFLQLEIEDKYLEGEGAGAGAGPDDKSGNLAYLSQGRVPFAQQDNPVMSVMGFLAGLADPAVTAAAAGKTVEEMKKHMRGKLEKEQTASGAEKDKDGEAEADTEAPAQPVKEETGMELDTVAPADKATNPASIALSLTAARSAALASHTERHLTSLISSSVNLQLQKLELKLQQFSEMESLLAAERRELDRQRQRLFLDRLAFRKRVREVENKFREMGVGVQGVLDQQSEEGERLGVKKVEGEDEGEGGEVRPLGEEEGAKVHEI